MKNIVKTGLATAVIAHATLVSAAIDFEGTNLVQGGVKGDDATADQAIQTIISRAVTFLYILALVYALYGGFNIMTAGGDEEKVKKGKTILIQAGIGLVVIFLANSIVSWIINAVLGI
jgi:hypothetical protein